MVLDRPEILHTNGSENDIRCQVTRRQVSAGTRSDMVVTAVMPSLASPKPAPSSKSSSGIILATAVTGLISSVIRVTFAPIVGTFAPILRTCSPGRSSNLDRWRGPLLSRRTTGAHVRLSYSPPAPSRGEPGVRVAKSGALSDHAFARKMRRRGPQRSASFRPQCCHQNRGDRDCSSLGSEYRNGWVSFILYTTRRSTITPPCAVNSRASLSSSL
jgi:hypothetical protein